VISTVQKQLRASLRSVTIIPAIGNVMTPSTSLRCILYGATRCSEVLHHLCLFRFSEMFFFRNSIMGQSVLLSRFNYVLTTHLHLVPRSRMRGALLPLPQYAFMAWCLVKAQGQLYFLKGKGKVAPVFF
jgi:hypothetical protein